jgi:uncharacterized protein
VRGPADDGGAVVSAPSIDFDALRPQIADLCRKWGIVELSVFGSVARGDDRPDSDVDLLYVSDPVTVKISGLAFFTEAPEDFAELLGRQVDLVPKEGLHWVIRDRVLADSRTLYAA